MPKRRGSGVGEGGGGVGAGLGGPIEVVQYSATRRRDELLRVSAPQGISGDIFVSSQSGNTYRVNIADPENATCTCPDHIYHRRECRHILGALSAVGLASSGVTSPEPTTSVAERAVYEAVRTDDLAAQRAEESAQLENLPPLPEHEVELTADSAVFRDLYRRARRGEVEYEYENVLDGSNNTFGVELEFALPDVSTRREAISRIARDLYDAGLINTPTQQGYHSPRVPGLWTFERDSSVNGGELVSPVFRDTPEAWRQIEQVCEIIQRHGGTVDRSCGAHVSIGFDPIDHDATRWRNLLRFCRANEELLYRMAAGGESNGRHRGTTYARPLSSHANAVNAGNSHYDAMNRDSRRIEMRYFNGTLSPKQIQANVRLAHALVQAAGRMSEAQEESALGNAPLGAMRDAARRNGERNRHQTARAFLDRIFTRTQDKLSVLWLYATSKWQTQLRA